MDDACMNSNEAGPEGGSSSTTTGGVHDDVDDDKLAVILPSFLDDGPLDPHFPARSGLRGHRGHRSNQNNGGSNNNNENGRGRGGNDNHRDWATQLALFKPSSLAQAIVNRLCGVANTKGFLLMTVLFLLRYRAFSSITKKVALLGSAIVALVANFNLDLDGNARRKSFTVGVSRMFTLGLCFLIVKRYRWSRAPFYCGLVARVVPVSMYYFFRGVYEITHKLLCRFENQELLPSSAASAIVVVPDASLQCCICLDVNCDYRTSCNHYFHRTCLEQWAEIKLHCPLCTQRIQTNHLWTRSLHNYFVLNYNEWREMHHFLCGNWWTESVFSRRDGT